MPTRLISSVRGIGVAVSVSTSTLVAQLLHRLLVLHAEALLLVDDEEAEVLELDVAGEQAVRPDHAVDLAGRQPVDDLARLARGEEAAEHLDADREAGEAVGERLAVLGRQQRRRREHGRLLAVLDRLERGADRHLRLAEADVAAHQPIHRVGPLHVLLDGDDRLALVGRLDVRKGVLHLRLPRRVGAEGEARRGHPLLVEDDELLGDLGDRRADAALRLGEVGAAEAVQRRGLAADVLAQRVDLVGRHVQLVVALVGEQQVVPLDAADRALDHPLVAPDAVVEVDDVHARIEVLEHADAVAPPGRGRRCARRRPVRSLSATIASARPAA